MKKNAAILWYRCSVIDYNRCHQCIVSNQNEKIIRNSESNPKSHVKVITVKFPKRIMRNFKKIKEKSEVGKISLVTKNLQISFQPMNVSINGDLE